MTTKLYNQEAKVVGETELPDFIFNQEWKPALVHQVLIAQQANRRKPIAHTKGRDEVRGGGRKPWRQKGTGRARHGSIRSPLWKGGGVTFGPTKEKNFSKKVNKKVKKQAFFSALSKKFSDGEVKVIDKIVLEKPKTKLMANLLNNFITDKRNDGLLVLNTGNSQISLAVRNLVSAQSLGVSSLSLEDILKYKNILFIQDSIKDLEEIYSKNS